MMASVAMVVLLAQVTQGAAAGAPAAVSASAEQTETRAADLDVTVQAAIVGDVLPRRDVAELRPRIGVELSLSPRPWATLKLDARADALVADRSGRASDLRAEVRDAWFEAGGDAGDVRVGFGRLAWGRLDEIAPTDVVNPIDVSRFLFEGRAEARLAVPFVRGRVRGGERITLEAVLVPTFRRGLFDRLEESTSPFNLVNDAAAALPAPASVESREPAATWQNVSGGGRADVTIGRVDVGVSAFRGFDGLGPVSVAYQAAPAPGVLVPRLVQEHPRFTMIGGDFETVTGVWAWRGEAALFTERSFSGAPAEGLVAGQSFDAGVGVDRRAGEFRVFASGIVHREWSDARPTIARTDVSLVGSVDRSFARDRFFARGVVVVNPGDNAAFLRGLFTWRPSDRWSLDGSAGAFVGTSDDSIGRFKTRDFVLIALRTWLR